VKAKKGGATEFLLKPFDEDDLVRAIHAAIAFDRRERERERERERAEEGSRRDFKHVQHLTHKEALRHGFPIAGFSGQVDEPEREASLIQSFIGGSGRAKVRRCPRSPSESPRSAGRFEG
jgi:YesN/AraC family two-component response regulator